MSSNSTEQKFLEAFEAYSDDLFRHGYFRLSDRERARDLVQDTFMKTWEYIRAGSTVDAFRPFLYRTLNNLIIDEYRKKKSVSLDALLENENMTEGVFDDLKTGGLDELISKLDAERFLKELSAMPENYRGVITMRFIDELKPKEIAHVLGESENAISVRIHRGLAWLRKHVQEKVV